MEQTLVNGIADNLLHNIFNDLSVGLELYDKDGLMIDVNYSRLRSMGIKDKKDILGYNLFNYTSFSKNLMNTFLNTLMKSRNRSEKEKQCVSWQNMILMTCAVFFLLICPV